MKRNRANIRPQELTTYEPVKISVFKKKRRQALNALKSISLKLFAFKKPQTEIPPLNEPPKMPPLSNQPKFFRLPFPRQQFSRQNELKVSVDQKQNSQQYLKVAEFGNSYENKNKSERPLYKYVQYSSSVDENEILYYLKQNENVNKKDFLKAHDDYIEVVLRFSQFWRIHVNYLLDPLAKRNHIADFERMCGFGLDHLDEKSVEFKKMQIKLTKYNLFVFLTGLDQQTGKLEQISRSEISNANTPRSEQFCDQIDQINEEPAFRLAIAIPQTVLYKHKLSNIKIVYILEGVFIEQKDAKTILEYSLKTCYENGPNKNNLFSIPRDPTSQEYKAAVEAFDEKLAHMEKSNLEIANFYGFDTGLNTPEIANLKRFFEEDFYQTPHALQQKRQERQERKNKQAKFKNKNYD